MEKLKLNVNTHIDCDHYWNTKPRKLLTKESCWLQSPLSGLESQLLLVIEYASLCTLEGSKFYLPEYVSGISISVQGNSVCHKSSFYTSNIFNTVSAQFVRMDFYRKCCVCNFTIFFLPKYDRLWSIRKTFSPQASWNEMYIYTIRNIAIPLSTTSRKCHQPQLKPVSELRSDCTWTLFCCDAAIQSKCTALERLTKRNLEKIAKNIITFKDICQISDLLSYYS